MDVDIGAPGIELVPIPNQASIGNEQKYHICCLDVDGFCIWNRETHGMPIPVWMHTSRNSLSSSQSPLQHQQRGRARPRWRPGGARPRWRSPAMGELDPPVMEERAAMTARTGWGRARSHPGHGGARPRMEEPDPGGNRPRRPWESSNLEPAGLGGASFHDRSRQIRRSSVPARPWGA